MTSRERVLAAIEHRGTGRIPFSVSAHNSLAVHGKKLLKILCRYPNDFFDPKSLKIPKMTELEKSLKTTDKWGCVWETANPLIVGAVTHCPLSDWANFKDYKMPVVTKVTIEDIDAANKTREKYPVWAGIDQFFQVMQDIRGSVPLFMDFYTQPEEVQKFIDRMLNEHHLPQLEEQLKLKPDIVGAGDDWGTQNALLINPELWRRFYKPVYQKLTDISHQAGAKIWFHTCGYTLEIIEEFIDIGIDVVNPQMAIMDAAKYGEIARGRITIFPDLNRQGILLNGTAGEVERHIIDMYESLGTSAGGLIGYCPIEPEMPLENVEAMLAVISNYEKPRI